MSTHDFASVIMYGNVQDAAADRIRKMIIDGELMPGDWLRQDELASALGVSTMPIREALRQLQSEGLVTFHPRRGAQVLKISVSHQQEIYRMREELSVLACHWAGEHFDDVCLDHLRRLLAEIQSAEDDRDTPRRLKLVREFFFTIFEASHKEHLLRILSNVWDLSVTYRRYFATLPEFNPRRMVDYRRIYCACEARDVQELVQAIRDMHAFGNAHLVAHLREEEMKEKAD